MRAKVPQLASSFIEDSWELYSPSREPKSAESGSRSSFYPKDLGNDRLNVKQAYESFRRQYGEYAVRQLGLYLVDLFGIRFSGGFTKDDFWSFIQRAHLILGMFGLRDFLVSEQGLDLAVQTCERDSLSFLVIDSDHI